MTLKIRKFMAVAVLLPCVLLLSACLPEMGATDAPPLDVSQVATVAESPDAPPLYCKVGRGEALFGQGWHDFNDTLFTLHKGSRTPIKISRIRNAAQMKIEVFFDSSGQKLVFCPFIKAAPNQRISCTSLYALEDDLKDGIRRTFDIPSALRGGVITCAYEQSKLRPFTGGN